MAEARMLTSKEAAELIGIKPATLRQWRYLGRGPAYVKFGGDLGRCMYRRQDVDRWISRNRRTG